jgi:hypothetical protein
MTERTQAVTVDVRFDPADTRPAEWDWAGLLDTDVTLAETGDPEPADTDGGHVQRLTLVVTYGDDDTPPSDWDWVALSDTDVSIVDADETDEDLVGGL